MKNDPPGTNAHKADLLLPYLEGGLTPKEREALEAHLSECSACSTELDGLREIVRTLKQNREAFCPELGDLYAFVHYGTDPEGVVGAHLEHCNSCRDVCDLLRLDRREDLPDAVAAHLALRARSRAPKAPSAARRWEEVFFGSLKRFRIPALAASLAAAALIAAVLLTPWRMPEYAVALSSVSWQQAPKPKEAGVSRVRAATVIVLKGFRRPLGQPRIDSLYAAVAPSMELYEKYHMVSPQDVKMEWERHPPHSSNRQSLIRWLNSRLQVSRASIVTITPSQPGMNVEADLTNPESGAVLNRGIARNVVQAQLQETIRRLVIGQFLPAAQPPPDTQSNG
jgi:hypothetical protein